jgi:type II pantothenate kinase
MWYDGRGSPYGPEGLRQKVMDMRIILGIDIGGSTTKIVGYSHTGAFISAVQVRAEDATTSAYGAFGKFLKQNQLNINDIEQISLTGVGSSQIEGDIFQIRTSRTNEFRAIGIGGLALSQKEEAIVISMGTGTAFVRASKDGITHIGGSGVGGGTIVGLCSKLVNASSFDTITDMASVGNLANVDLMIQDISAVTVGSLPPHATASNFGKLRDNVTNADITLGILNMTFQTIGMMAVFAARNDTIKDIVLTGTLALLPQAQRIFSFLGELYHLNFIIPEYAVYATAIGAALSDLKKLPNAGADV